MYVEGRGGGVCWRKFAITLVECENHGKLLLRLPRIVRGTGLVAENTFPVSLVCTCCSNVNFKVKFQTSWLIIMYGCLGDLCFGRSNGVIEYCD
jgi:hypothetical protein